MKTLLYIFLLLFISETLEAQNARGNSFRKSRRIVDNWKSPEPQRPESSSVRQRRFLENNLTNKIISPRNRLSNNTVIRSNQDILVNRFKRNDLTPQQIKLATKLQEVSLSNEHDFISATIRALDRITDPKKISDLIKILDDAQINLSITNNNYSQAMDIALFRNGYQKDPEGRWCI